MVVSPSVVVVVVFVISHNVYSRQTVCFFFFTSRNLNEKSLVLLVAVVLFRFVCSFCLFVCLFVCLSRFVSYIFFIIPFLKSQRYVSFSTTS